MTGSRPGGLAITAAVRYAEARRRGLAGDTPAVQAEQWLGPARAFMLSTGSTPLPARPLTTARREQVTGTLATLAAGLPPWQALLALPLRYARLYPARGAISASSATGPSTCCSPTRRSPPAGNWPSRSCTSWPISGCT